MKVRTRALAATASAALIVSACTNAPGGGSPAPARTLVVGIDLPMQGDSRAASEATVNAMKLYLDQVGGRAGGYRIELKVYDDSAASTGTWDARTCRRNAFAHMDNRDEVAVMGTYNSGCAKIIVPLLNADPHGPMLMVSGANSNPGLTTEWEPGEPAVYYPAGSRSYARVNPTDDADGKGFAQFAANDLGVERCYVLNDASRDYGIGIARAFAREARRNGVQIVGEARWRTALGDSNVDVFEKVKKADPDCVFLAGTPDNNGERLVQDKVAVLGDHSAVTLLGPSGWLGFPALKKPEAQGMYVSGVSVDYLRSLGPASTAFLDAYQASYGAEIASAYAFYGAVALQVILTAIERSDGTRTGVRDAVFEGAGLTVPATVSLTGKDLAIDPATGDAGSSDVSIMRLENGDERLIAVVEV